MTAETVETDTPRCFAMLEILAVTGSRSPDARLVHSNSFHPICHEDQRPFGQDGAIIQSQPPRLSAKEIAGMVHAFSNPVKKCHESPRLRIPRSYPYWLPF